MKKYHPDKYNDNPLRDLAEEKMREINEAYQYLMREAPTSHNYGYRSSWGYSDNGTRRGSNDAFARVREHISRNDLRAAEYELNSIDLRNAEWYFLRGLISLRKGWYSQAYDDLRRAVEMDPSNYEYRDVLNRVVNSNRSYTNYSYKRRGSTDNDLCTTCACLCCGDQCCECLGGDLISCC